MLSDFLGAIAQVRGPLTFWAFCATIVLGIAIVLLRDPQWLKLLLRSTDRRLPKTQFAKILKLVIISGFILSLLTILLAFAAPLLLERIRTDREIGSALEETRSAIDEARDTLIAVVGTASSLAQVRALFADHQYERAAALLDQLLTSNGLRPTGADSDILVATYFGAGDYASAAREVLEQDRKLPRGDRSLWYDLALSIRRFALANSAAAALELVDSLQQHYDDNLLSHAWAVVPTEVLNALKSGYHNHAALDEQFGQSEDTRNALHFVTQRYAEDPYIEFALYSLKRFDDALAAEPQSLIRDHILFGLAHELYNQLGGNDLNSPIPPNNSMLGQARLVYQQYIREYPNAMQADDACVRLGILEMRSGNLDDALFWVRQAQRRGNGDFQGTAAALETDWLMGLPAAALETRLRIDSLIVAPYTLWYVLARSHHLAHRYPQSIALAEHALRTIDDHYVNARSTPLWREGQNRLGLEYLVSAGQGILAVLDRGTPDDYLRIGNNLRRDHRDFRAAIFVFDSAVAQFPRSVTLEKIEFLRILAYREWSPELTSRQVDQFLTTYPNSQLADDALAELVFVHSYQGNLEEVESTLNRLLNGFPKDNAVDNAVNWAARAYERRAQFDPSYTARAVELYQTIVERFPTSRIAGVARDRLNRLQR